MSTEIGKRETKGKLSWVIILLEVITAIAYFVIYFKNIADSAMDFDFVGSIQGVKSAVWFLVIAWAILAALCFVPIFKSKFNKIIAICNIIGIALNISFLIG